jgi:hypothetical protein
VQKHENHEPERDKRIDHDENVGQHFGEPPLGRLAGQQVTTARNSPPDAGLCR